MNSVVLARKYRPRRFEDMVGQDASVRALSNALQQGRLHHAYLFTGTRGIGKTTVSRIFAKCLNCVGADGQGGITATPCGVCGACVQIDQDRFIDYIELDAASNRGIDETRDLLERAAYKPAVGRFKVFMIDEAHQLTKESFNALLKTLEEPPDYVKFVLATTDPQKMPATVLSRCLQFSLRPMAPVTIREHLARVLTAEGIAHDAAALGELGRAAHGSMRDALSLTDQAIVFGGGRLDAVSVRQMLGSVGREPVLALITALAAFDGRSVVLQVNALREQGLSPDGTLEAMAGVLQDMAVEQAVPGALDVDGLDVEAIRQLAEAMPADDTQLLYSLVLHGRRELPLAPDAYAGLLMVLLRMLAFADRATDDATPGASARTGVRRAPAAALRADADRATASASVDPSRSSVVASPALPAVSPADTGLTAATPAAPAPLSFAAPMDSTVAAPTVMPETMDPGATPSAASPAAASPLADAQRTALGDRWMTIVTQMNEARSIAALVRELAMQSALTAVDDDAAPPRWQLQVERESLRSAANVDRLTTALSALLEAPQRIEVTVGPVHDCAARRDSEARAKAAQEAERIVRDDPLVQDMLTRFTTARIVPGSIKTTQEFKP